MVVNYSIDKTYYEDGDARVFETERPEVFLFEHRTLGDEGYTGSVWLEGKRIVDYDGVFTLPADVVSILEQLKLIHTEELL